MTHRIPLALACLLGAAGILPAQERIAPPPPDPGPAAQILPPPSSSSPVPVPPTGVSPVPPPGPAPYSLGAPYSPRPGFYTPPPGADGPPPYVPGRFLDYDPACDPCFWVGFEGLLWWTKNQPLPVPVVTTGPAAPGGAGALGAAGTVNLNGPLNNGVEGGGRLFVGGWFNSDHTFGMEGSLFVLGQQSTNFGVADPTGNGGVVINEPVAGAPFPTLVSAPGLESGNVFVGATSQVWGGDIDFLFNVYRANNLTINLLGGYRYLQLAESLDIVGNSQLLVATTYFDGFGNALVTAPPGSTVSVVDRFHTRNEFNGGQIGTEFSYQWGRWSIAGTAEVAIGATHEVVTVNGFANVFPTNAPAVSLSGGNFATQQIGRYSTDRFAVAPQAQLKVGYQITPWMRAEVGYDFLFLSNVARPGNQIDNTFDGVAHPSVPMTSSSFWAQGLNLGLQFRF
jgi:hypothetical protein